MQATQQTALYGQLIANAAINARESDGYANQDIAELAATIKAKGLLQPLVVRSGSKGKYEIADGRRRHMAIGMLIKQNVWPATQEIPIMIREETDHDALESSLIANIERKPMHPVQEFEIFSRLHDGGKGKPVQEIASRYGITTAVVRQRLALGALAPEVQAAWRSGKITADAAKVFATVPDKKRQTDGFKALQKQGSCNLQPNYVKAHFLKNRPTLDDARLKFVGIDAYKAAGGKVVEMLFGDDGYLEDGNLLDRLASEAIENKCKALVVEGWAWALPAHKVGNDRYSWARLQAKKSFTDDEKARVKEIDAESKKIERSRDEDDDAADARYDALAAERSAIEDAASLRGFTKKQKAESGVIIALSGFELTYDFGVVQGKSQKSLDREKAKAKTSDDDADAGDEPQSAISATLLADISGWQTKAVAEALSKCPSLAVRVVAAALAPVRGRANYLQSPVRLTANGMLRGAQFDKEDDDPLEDERVGSGFGTAFEAIPEKRAAEVLAVNLARAIDLRQLNHASVAVEEIEALVAALPGDIYLKAMRAAFDAEDYFSRASGKVALAALEEMKVTAFDRKANKSALSQIAAKEAKAKGWLPAELRHPDYAKAAGTKKKAA